MARKFAREAASAIAENYFKLKVISADDGLTCAPAFDAAVTGKAASREGERRCASRSRAADLQGSISPF
jgi:hypothetical protein